MTFGPLRTDRENRHLPRGARHICRYTTVHDVEHGYELQTTAHFPLDAHVLPWDEGGRERIGSGMHSTAPAGRDACRPSS